MKPLNWTRSIAGLSAIAVLFLAIGGFVLSYSALHEVALSAGVPARLAWVWPLLIDLALVIFSLAVLRAYLLGEKPHWPWVLVGIFTLATITFNIIHSGDDVTSLLGIPLPYLIGIVPPIALVLGFETLMGMLRNSVQRQKFSQSLDDLKAEIGKSSKRLDNLRSEWANEQDNIKRQKGQIEQAKQTIEQLREERERLNQETIKAYIPDNLEPESRQQIVYKMVNDDLTIGQMAELLGVSEGTIKNDKRAIRMNGNGRG